MEIITNIFPCCTKRKENKPKIDRSFMLMGNVETEEQIDLSKLNIISGHPRFIRRKLILEPHGTYLCKCNCSENRFFWKIGDDIKYNNVCIINTYKNYENLQLFTNLKQRYINVTICKM